MRERGERETEKPTHRKADGHRDIKEILLVKKEKGEKY